MSIKVARNPVGKFNGAAQTPSVVNFSNWRKKNHIVPDPFEISGLFRMIDVCSFVREGIYRWLRDRRIRSTNPSMSGYFCVLCIDHNMDGSNLICI
jgi:hypothetical protein